MTAKSKTLIFFGNERLASGVKTEAPVLNRLIHAGYDIPFIVVSQKPAKGRNKTELEVEQVATKHGIEVKYVSRLADIHQDIADSGAATAVLAAFGRIIPQSTIDQFENGIINIHPSLLPEFRGPTPIESAILSGQAKTGVSIMRLSAGMDEGPIYGFSEADIKPDESKQSLFERLAEIGSTMLLELLPKIVDGSLSPMEQDHSKASYSKKISKDDGAIDWVLPAEQINREIRAYYGWPGSYTKLGGKDVTITEAEVVNQSGKAGEVFKLSKSRFGVYCGQQALEIRKLKPAGKPKMSAAGFLAGNKL